jgi:uncharacterized protein
VSIDKKSAHQRKIVSGEMALLLGIVVNSFSVTLFVKSDMGMSTIALASYVLSLVFYLFSFGTWSYIIQCALVFVLVALLKTIKPGYVISFVLAIIYGCLIDFFNQFVVHFPDSLMLHVLYYCIGFCGIALGTCLLFKCSIPVLPFDTFTRDISLNFNISYKKIRTCFDISCVVFSAAIGLFFIGSFKGIGIGTIVNSLFVGMSVNMIADYLDKRFYFKPSNSWIERLS